MMTKAINRVVFWPPYILIGVLFGVSIWVMMKLQPLVVWLDKRLEA